MVQYFNNLFAGLLFCFRVAAPSNNGIQRKTSSAVFQINLTGYPSSHLQMNMVG